MGSGERPRAPWLSQPGLVVPDRGHDLFTRRSRSVPSSGRWRSRSAAPSRSGRDLVTTTRCRRQSIAGIRSTLTPQARGHRIRGATPRQAKPARRARFPRVLDGVRPRPSQTPSTTRRKPVSRILYTGFQYDPVLSIATWLTSASASQSASLSSSRVVVPNVRTSRAGSGPGPGVSRQATTVLLWTSSPAHRGWTTFHGHASCDGREGAHPFRECLACSSESEGNRR
jgi:hypothetical protein